MDGRDITCNVIVVGLEGLSVSSIRNTLPTIGLSATDRQRVLGTSKSLEWKMKTLIDISAIYWRMWHASAEDDVSSARRKTMAVVDGIGSRHGIDNCVVCLDSPPYWRKEIYPEYKAQREARSAASIEELRRAIESCADAGYSIAHSDGMEADDVIATLNSSGACVIYGSDKDLLQCGPIVDPIDGTTKTAIDRMGVASDKVPDWLALVGDSADNMPGVTGVGQKTATALLAEFGSVEAIIDAAENKPDKWKRASIREVIYANAETIKLMKQIATLRTDVDVQIERREPKQMEYEIENNVDESATMDTGEIDETSTEPRHAIVPAPPVRCEALTYRQSLEPQTMAQAWKAATVLHQSRLYTAYGTPEAIFAIIMRGRALGIDATTALDSMHVIKGKPTMAASFMVALVLNSGKCEYFDCVEHTDKSCTWKTKRVGSPHEITRAFTIEEARAMDLTGRDNWKKQPAVMLQWRCAAALARMVYADVLAGLYAIEEMEA
jgi:5'-3' exonuclease